MSSTRTDCRIVAVSNVKTTTLIRHKTALCYDRSAAHNSAAKVSDHWVRSPLLNISRACQTCHKFSEDEIRARVDVIQDRNYNLMQRAAAALMAQMDAILAARSTGATDEQMKPVLELQRKAQWRIDFVAAENSMGFHAPQEASRILGEAIDYARQGEILAFKAVKTAP